MLKRLPKMEGAFYLIASIISIIVVSGFESCALQKEKSHIVFITQIAPKRNAWQNLSWEPNFHRNWDEKRIKESVNHFLANG